MSRQIFRLCCLGLLLAACAPSNVDDGALDSIDPGGGPADNANECTPGDGAAAPTIQVDIATLAQCCQDQPGSAAHCVPTDQIPATFQPVLEDCPGGGECVPDKFITAGGITNLKTCASLGGADGRCLSTCVPQVKQYIDLLPMDVCGADERCVPCISPLDQKPTGVCNAASTCTTPGTGGTNPTPSGATCENPGAPLVQAATLPSCGEGAHCLSTALVPADFASRLADCPGGTSKCVPDAFIEKNGKFTPASCTSLYSAEGRCLSKVLPEIGAQADRLPTAGCGANEVCAPCFNPFDGTDTGACRISCDAGPAQPARVAPSCCENRAKCVPTQSIPAAQQETLGEDTCGEATPAADYLCVPNELVLNKPIPTCSATGLILGNYTGVCLSECLEFGLQGIALKQGNCQDDYKCVPCVRNGEPTGAPGCPAP